MASGMGGRGRLPTGHPKVRYRKGLAPFQSKKNRPDHSIRVAHWTYRLLNGHQKRMLSLLQKVGLAQEKRRNAIAELHIQNPSSAHIKNKLLRQSILAEKEVLRTEKEYLTEAVDFDYRFPFIHPTSVQTITKKELLKKAVESVDHRLEMKDFLFKTKREMLSFKRRFRDLRSQIVQDEDARKELENWESRFELAMHGMEASIPYYNSRHANLDRQFEGRPDLFQIKYRFRVRIEQDFSQVYLPMLAAKSALLGFLVQQAKKFNVKKPFLAELTSQYRDAVNLEHHYSDFVQRLLQDQAGWSPL